MSESIDLYPLTSRLRCNYMGRSFAGRMEVDLPTPVMLEAAEAIERLTSEISRYRNGIIDCLDKNGHLADGDNCSLIDLKKLVPEWDTE